MKSFRLLLVFVTIFFVPNMTNAQGYTPFPEVDAYWTVMEFDYQIWDYDTFIYTIKGDTIVNNVTYKKIFQLSDIPGSSDTLWVLHNLMRQDTMNEKVYFIRLYQLESTEKLGYNFDVEIGDTVSLPAFDYNNTGDSLFEVLFPGLDSTLLWNGEYRSNCFYGSIDPYSGLSIFAIEGVGSKRTPFPNLFYFDDFHESETVCHLVGGEYLYGSTQYPDHCDFSVGLLENETESSIHIYPLPANNSFTIQIDPPGCINHISLRDAIGNVVQEIDFNPCIKEYTFNTKRLVQGIYFILIYSTMGVHTRAVIINH